MNLNNLLRTRAEFQIHRTRRNYYFYGSKPSRLLALSSQKCEKYSNITAICSKQRVLTAPKEINTEFKSFYSELYRSDAELLGESITLTELKNVLAGMKKGQIARVGWDPPRLLSHLLGLVGTILFSHDS